MNSLFKYPSLKVVFPMQVTEATIIGMRLDSERLETPRLTSILGPSGEVNMWLQHQVSLLLLDCGSCIGGAFSNPGASGKNAPSKNSGWMTLPKESLKSYATEYVFSFLLILTATKHAFRKALVQNVLH